MDCCTLVLDDNSALRDTSSSLAVSWPGLETYVLVPFELLPLMKMEAGATWDLGLGI